MGLDVGLDVSGRFDGAGAGDALSVILAAYGERML
jgi:hypothetical protein